MTRSYEDLITEASRLLAMEDGEREARLYAMDEREAKRIRRMLARDAEDRADARRRVSPYADETIPPTPEQLRSGSYVPHSVAAERQRATATNTYRNVGASRILQLHERGVIDDMQFVACDWYRGRWEGGELAPAFGIGTYGVAIPGGDKAYGHLPRHEAALQWREDFRWAQGLISKKLVGLFDDVVLQDMTLTDVAAKHRCAKGLATLRFKMAASELHLGIMHVLPILQKMQKSG